MVEKETEKLSDNMWKDLEQIAENVHNAWAQERLRQGWRYGSIYDRTDKTHPSLIPYGDLTELEKQVDRETALQVIRILIRLGYRIEKE